MEATTEKKKKRNGDYYLKQKIAKLEAENEKLRMQRDDVVPKKVYETVENERDKLQKTIDQQSRKISQLTADLKAAQGNLEVSGREHERQLKEMYDHMGWFKRMTWDWHHAPTFKEDDKWNETH